MSNEALATVTFDAVVVISSAENPFGDGICPKGSAVPTQSVWNIPSCTIREYKGSWLIKILFYLKLPSIRQEKKYLMLCK